MQRKLVSRITRKSYENGKAPTFFRGISQGLILIGIVLFVYGLGEVPLL